MFIMWSKKTGRIKAVAQGDRYHCIGDLFPEDGEDYDEIYNYAQIEESPFLGKNFRYYKVVDGKVVANDDEINTFKDIDIYLKNE